MAASSRGANTGELHAYIAEESSRTLEAYRAQPNLVAEHSNHEEDTARGGYAGRQLFELVQNGADALSKVKHGGSIEICLTKNYLYCADDGAPIDRDGVRALMFSHLSPKRGTTEIGRFGLGFKSVLGVTDVPEFFNRSGSFRFNRDEARRKIANVVPNAERYPVLRLAFPVDHERAVKQDRTLRRLSRWASNIVRLPLNEGGFASLEEQIRGFPAEFLLFAEHVGRLTLRDLVSKNERAITVVREGRKCELKDSSRTGPAGWMLFSFVHTLSSDARADRRTLDDNDKVPIHWAAPLDRVDRPGHFWAFFPTKTSSLVAGILNAPWKTNEDRQNLLGGPYNEELIEAAAALIADSLPMLSTEEDPSRHLDALPRRQQADDSEQVNLLRERLFDDLRERDIVPDEEGLLRPVEALRYPPREFVRGRQTITAPLERWAAFSDRPRDWLHHRAMTVNRLAALDRLHPDGRVPGASLSEWLEALVGDKSGHDPVTASMAAIQTAAAIPPNIRPHNTRLGKVALTANGVWRTLDPEGIFLPDPDAAEDSVSAFTVHPALSADDETRDALEELGIVQVSPESRFRLLTERLSRSESDASLLEAFWRASRRIDPLKASNIVKNQEPTEHRWNWPEEKQRFWSQLCARTRTGEWKPLHALLLPGFISADDCEGYDAFVDTAFHAEDLALLERLGVTEGPRARCDLVRESWFSEFRSDCRDKYYDRLTPGSSQPQRVYLNFVSGTGSGPLEVMESLSEDSRADYTEALLSLDMTYEYWVMRHETRRDTYPKVQYASPAVEMLKKYGCIRTSDGIAPVHSVLGKQPENPAALHTLLEHPKAEKIREAFDLADLTPDSYGEPDVTDEEEPVPLLDEWPGLGDYLPDERKNDRLIRCERIRTGGVDWDCFPYGSNVYLVRAAEEGRALGLVVERLKLGLSAAEIALILRRETPGEIRARREAVRREATDAARLLKAVGEAALRSELPGSLLAILEEHEGRLTGFRVAEAAIATWHTDTLRHFREHLHHLDPPRQWAGSGRAVRFVTALGFPAEWAGEKHRRRDPFLEVDGPFTLPELHPYQNRIVDNVRGLLRYGNTAQRRGMISMPTGSGKTRVAVQAVVEALREEELAGGILWVADRDELCEQAVEAWGQVWASKGARREQLRISRLWQGQPDPLPTGDRHVVVASVQTLAARFRRKPDDYGFLADFALVVFDEAHRSIAPTYTEVMQELGMGGRRRRPGEPFLIGLTATPYRGHNERETEWLVRRYGEVRLDAGAFRSDNPHEVVTELQQMKVLAEADQSEIDGGALSLSADELDQMEASPWLPQSAEDRIARDSERTMRIIEAFETHIEPDWPTLIFATSVEHAQTLAALLSGRGITAHAVSGTTESSARRRIVEEFRNGGIQALVNYGVFREGFDAPRTRAIVVARPVYSPNLYFQMIGRGLRGKLNGGNDRCLILNVRDNILNYDRQLAFSDLDWLWGESQQARAA
ncbi:MAG: DEAD/DEAH box helicase [Alphaproteobacteria bacterium]|nr:DEAD/DEAH box helicase [Alphaproteobacteria bacterium]